MGSSASAAAPDDGPTNEEKPENAAEYRKPPIEELYDTSRSKSDHISCILDAIKDDIDDANLNVPEIHKSNIEEIQSLLKICQDEEMLHSYIGNLATQLQNLETGGQRLSDIIEKIEGLGGYIYGRVPEVILLGETGSGKSTLGNVFLYGKDAFEDRGVDFGISSGAISFTTSVSPLSGKWLGTGHQFTVVDCPGLNDSEGRDLEHMKKIVQEIKELPNVTVFVLVLNSKQPRLTQSLYDMLDVFSKTFNKEFFDHLVIFFTHWAMNPHAVRNRTSSGVSENFKKEQVCDAIRLRYSLSDTMDIQCFFLDCVEYGAGIGDDLEAHETTLARFEQHVCNLQCYRTSNMATWSR